MHVTEEQVINALIKYIKEADSDEVSILVERAFGGECWSLPHKDDVEDKALEYCYFPGSDYGGEFGKAGE